MLYRNWKAQVYCSKESDTCLTMDFHARNIECLRISGDISEQLQILCRTLETCLQEWHEFMGKRRATFYHLNYYTAEQIVYLCSELGSFAAGNLLSEQVLAMLSFIKPHCTAKEIGRVMHQADAVDEEIDALQEIEESQEFDASLKDAGMSKTSYQTENANLPKAINLLWTRFMGNMTTFLIDHLDTVAFGELLGQLSTLNVTIVRRQFPSSLHCGRPNLLTCSRPEIFKTALCIYMQNPDQPLPSYDEVLLCCEETTCEEVELFLRRALSRGSREQKIYTLIHADCLNYETSVRFGELFEELTLHCNPDYQLVVICDDKRQHCYIPSYLCHYKVPIGLNIKTEAIQQYLVHHFTVSQRRDSAANVFYDDLSVRIISSKRPGVGK